MSEVQARLARIEAVFRDANEQIRGKAEEAGILDHGFPVICECANQQCTEVFAIASDDYEDVRAHPARFFIVPGHELPDEKALTISGPDGFVVLEKTGSGAAVAEELDPRS